MRKVIVVLAVLLAGSWVAPGLDGQSAFGDPTLARLIDAALESNPDLRAVESRIRAARADRLHAALDLAPTVTASGGYTRQRLSGAAFPGLGGRLPDQDLWEAGLRMSWELDVFGRGRRSLDGRGALLDAAEEDVQDTRVLLSAEVADAYFGLRGRQDRLAVAKRNADNQRRTLDITIERLEAGRGTALDTVRAQAQLSSTLADIPSLQAAVAAAEHRIAVLLGREPGALGVELGEAGELPALPAEVELGNVGELVLRRPDVRGAARREDASAAFVSAAKADYLPRIAITGAAGYTASQFDRLGNSGTPRYAVGPVISWPLFDLGRVKADIDGAQAVRAEARARHEGAVLRAREEVATSKVAYERAYERLRHLEYAALASERATELVRLRFIEGAADFLEVLDSERRLLEAQDRLSAGRTEASTALVGLYRALGGAWPEEGEG